MNILFIYPNAEGYGRVPLGPSIIITCLLNEGHNVSLFDTTFIRHRGHVENVVREKAGFVQPTDMSHLYDPHSPEDVDQMLKERVRKFSPDLIAMSIVEENYRYGDHLLRVAKSVKKKVPVIVGGPTPTLVPQVVIENPRIDYLCQGEGEEAMVEFCDLVGRGISVEGVRNIWYKTNEVVRRNQLRPLTDMDSLPIQRLEIWDKRHFLKPYVGRLWQAGYFELSRGCPHSCSYCVHQQYRLLYCDTYYCRRKSVANAIEEIKTLKGQHAFEIIFFCDDYFLLMSGAAFKEFIERWKDEIRLPYWMNTAPESITEHRLAKLKESGCHGIGIGVESGSERVRTNILKRKYISNQDLERKIRMVDSFGIRATANNMMGSPGESLEEIFETVRFNRRARPASVDMTFMTPYMGTEMYNMAKSQGCLRETYKEPGFRGMVKGIRMRKGNSMRLPISTTQLNDILSNFSDYVYGNLNIPEE